jgi:predicted esterase
MDHSVMIILVRGWTTTGDPLLFGWRGGEIRPDFIDKLKSELGAAEVWAPELDMSMFCMRTAESLSQELFDKIDQKLAQCPHILHIVLVGYSSGSLLARRVFCSAHGADHTGQVSRPAAWWADKIDRLVVISGITRGWEYSSASPAYIRFLSPVLLNVAKLVGWWKSLGGKDMASLPFIWQLRRGSPFVISTRIQYVNVMEALRNQPVRSQSPLRVDGLPSSVFLLGAQDEFISPADCTELGPRSEFAFVELQNSNHAQVMHITGDGKDDTQRCQRLVAAVQDDFSSLTAKPWAVLAEDIDDYSDPMDIAGPKGGAQAPSTVTHAVIIMHGIRDNGFWTKRVAREIKTLGRAANIAVRAPTPTYGYFSMWDFIKPGGREEATFWFMERYADVKSHFPNAKISFVGHSNGTYIAAHALELCPAIQFDNIMFAGSVVRCDFPWHQYSAQVRAVLNYVGSADAVVACLPGVFERLWLRSVNLGGAGAFGFHAANQPAQSDTVQLKEYRYVVGSHAAAIVESYWPEIASFALSGAYPEQRQPAPRGFAVNLFFRHAPPVVLALALLAIVVLVSPWLVGGYLILSYATADAKPITSVSAGIVFFTLCFIFSWILSRFLRKW